MDTSYLGVSRLFADIGKLRVYKVRVDSIPPGQTAARIVFRAK
jgi:hypothetical protein